jgi:hypothetical protein
MARQRDVSSGVRTSSIASVHFVPYAERVVSGNAQRQEGPPVLTTLRANCRELQVPASVREVHCRMLVRCAARYRGLLGREGTHARRQTRGPEAAAR